MRVSARFKEMTSQMQDGIVSSRETCGVLARYDICVIDQARSRKMAGYCRPRSLWSIKDLGLCSGSAQWPLAPNFCYWATKSTVFHTNDMLGTLDFTGSEHWAPLNIPYSTALAKVTCFLRD